MRHPDCIQRPGSSFAQDSSVRARESSGKPRAARENLKIADIGPRAPRVVWLRRVYSPSEVWQVNLWLALAVIACILAAFFILITGGSRVLSGHLSRYVAL